MTAVNWKESLEKLRLAKWEARYHGPVPSGSAPGGMVDMWIMVDSETGEGIVSLGVPLGRSDIAGYVAAACGNPVRWVTEMDVRDPRADKIDDPDNMLRKEASAIADALFAVLIRWLETNKRNGQANAYTLNDALAWIWFTFCGQLDHSERGRLIFRFMQLATQDIDPDTFDEPPTENAR